MLYKHGKQNENNLHLWVEWQLQGVPEEGQR